MAADSLRMIMQHATKNFFVAFTAVSEDQLKQIRSIPDPRVTGPNDLESGQALTCSPIVINGKSFPVLHVRTADEIS